MVLLFLRCSNTQFPSLFSSIRLLDHYVYKSSSHNYHGHSLFFLHHFTGINSYHYTPHHRGHFLLPSNRQHSRSFQRPRTTSRKIQQSLETPNFQFRLCPPEVPGTSPQVWKSGACWAESCFDFRSGFSPYHLRSVEQVHKGGSQ